MEKRGLILRSELPYRQIGDATQKMVRLGLCAGKSPRNTKAGCCSFSSSGGENEHPLKNSATLLEFLQAVVQNLAKKGYLEFYEEKRFRNPYENSEAAPAYQPQTLSPEQEQAFQSLLHQYKSESPEPALLFGVTGSGKTSVFMRLADEVRRDGRGVIVMVPEISLTPQTVAHFHHRYGKDVAVFHSGLTLAERMDEWKRVKNGDAHIAVGTRSAVFAPLSSIGLIVMDEEQEHTYKSESSPRYHAREVAKFRCAYHGALLVLSFCHAFRGKLLRGRKTSLSSGNAAVPIWERGSSKSGSDRHEHRTGIGKRSGAQPPPLHRIAGNT